MLQHYINHISLIVDGSGSMGGHKKKVVEVFDAELNRLKQRSVDMDQETRISIYIFDSTVRCLTFDMDVMRFKSLADHYDTGGQTALLDAIDKSIEDHKKLPELYGDHAFLQYVLTDGEENSSRRATRSSIQNDLAKLPENWTTAILVPDARGVHAAKGIGLPAESISVWDTSGANAMEKVGKQFTTAIDNYMVARSQGVRGTRSFFQMDASALKKEDLQKLSALAYDIIPVRRESPIKEYVEQFTGKPYRLGSAYYMPTKKVKVQDHKNILVQAVKTGTVYEGSNMRSLLGLPPQTVEVDPDTHSKDWRIFVQSTSVNRKLFPDTFVLVMK